MDFEILELVVERDSEKHPIPCNFSFDLPLGGDTFPQCLRMESRDAEALIRALAPFCDSIVSITPTPIIH